LRDGKQRLAAGLRHHLHFACALQDVHVEERLRDRIAAREQPVIAQDHEVHLSQIRYEPRLLLRIEGHALIVVVRKR